MEEMESTGLGKLIEASIETIEPIDTSAPEGVDPELWKQYLDEEEARKDPVLSHLKRTMNGQNIGLSNGLTNINKYIYGTHKAMYYLEAGESGAYKTTITDFKYVIMAWLEAKKAGRPIKIKYLSFEIGKLPKIYRWIGMFIFLKYKVQLPFDYLMGKVPGRLPSKQHMAWILEAYATVREMQKDVQVIEDVMHPTKIFEGMVEDHFAKHGTVTRAAISKEDEKKGKKGYVKSYVENDPNLMTILIIDHLALTGTEMGLETKGIMDKMSKYAIVLRNLFHCTVVFVQQFSVDMLQAYRGLAGKKTEANIMPNRLDFGDSKATYRDADIVSAYVKPQSNGMLKFNSYDLSPHTGLGGYFVANYLMKNRYGPSDRLLPLFVDAVSGYVYDLPLDPNNLIAMEEWYEYAQKLEQICQLNSPQSLSPLRA